MCFASLEIQDCTTSESGETELGRKGRQTGKYCSLSSGGQKSESTALQNINLEKDTSGKHFLYFDQQSKKYNS